MKIGWVGLGKLGAVCAVVLDRAGHEVIGYDVSPEPAAYLEARKVPYREAGLDALLATHEVTVAPSVEALVAERPDVVFVAVQTPHAPDYDGTKPAPAERRDFEYGHLVQAVRSLATAAEADARRHLPVLVVSTVLPGTFDRLLRPLAGPWLELAYNPYFIAMGTVVADFTAPEFVLVGADDRMWAETVALSVYRAVHGRPIRVVSIPSAELTKVAYNVYVSAKVTIANYVGELAERTGADADEVSGSLAMATDRILSPRYMTAGMGDGGGCFPPGELVITEAGPRPIETIRAGERVLTFDGTLQPVVKTWERHYDGELVVLQVEGLPWTRMTADHPVIAKRDLRRELGLLMPNGRRTTKVFPRSETAEVPAGDLFEHYLLFPTPDVEPPALPAYATPEYLELAGWWLAEGTVYFDGKGSGRLTWCLHLDEVAYAERIMELIAACAPPRPNGRGGNARIGMQVNLEHHQRDVRFGSKILSDRIVGDFGRLQHDRFLPPWALWGDEKTALLLLDGLLKGDGHINDHGVTYSTTSTHLAWGVFVLLTRLGYRPTLRSIAPRTGRDGTHHRHAYEVDVHNRAQARELFLQLGIDRVPRGAHEVKVDAWRAVRKVQREHYSGPVHNLWVAGTNTYVTSAGAVHNCHPRDLIALSWLAERTGMSHDLAADLMAAREAHAAWLADLTRGWAELTGLPVIMLGKAYKPESNLTGGSPAALVRHFVGPCLDWWDPHVDEGEPTWTPAVYFVATRHPEFPALEVPAGSVVVDPFGYMPDREGVTVVRPGRH